MRRFSQRNPLVTLSEINITPLLDLAFVLLIIFIITTPLLEKSVNVKLPVANSATSQAPHRENVRTVEITMRGEYRLQKQPMQLQQVLGSLRQEFAHNSEIVVSLRADENTPYKYWMAVLDGCRGFGLTAFTFKTVERH